MTLGIELVLFSAGLALMIRGGDLFVGAASWIAEVSGIPKFLVGATIVSIATTLPELIVSVLAALEGKVDMAVGNAVGSVMANTAMIFAVSALFASVTVTRREYAVKAFCLLASGLLLLLASRTGVFQRWGTITLLLILAVFILDSVKQARAGKEEAAERPSLTGRALARRLGMFVLGAAGIVFGSQLLVSSGSSIAVLLGVPEGIVAVTLVAAGTSLPELVTAVAAIAKKQSGLSAGNIIGANIIDLCLILPLCDLLSASPLPISDRSILLDMPVCLLALLLCMLPLLLQQRSSRLQGAALLALYAGYLTVLL